MKKIMLITACILSLSVGFSAWGNPVASPDVERVSSAGPTVQGGVGRIYFTAGNQEVTFRVYSITGQLLRTVKVSADGKASVELPKGFYVVRLSGQGSRKVVVK